MTTNQRCGTCRYWGDRRLERLFDVAPSAVHFAEGWLSSGYGGLFMAGWNGARFEGYAIWLRPLKAILIARNMKQRGLYRGFDLKPLSSDDVVLSDE